MLILTGMVLILLGIGGLLVGEILILQKLQFLRNVLIPWLNNLSRFINPNRK